MKDIKSGNEAPPRFQKRKSATGKVGSNLFKSVFLPRLSQGFRNRALPFISPGFQSKSVPDQRQPINQYHNIGQCRPTDNPSPLWQSLRVGRGRGDGDLSYSSIFMTLLGLNAIGRSCDANPQGRELTWAVSGRSPKRPLIEESVYTIDDKT